MQVLLEENPMMEGEMYDNPEFNPWLASGPVRKKKGYKLGWVKQYGKRRKSKNPITDNPVAAGVREWSQGVDLMDVVSGVSGLAGASLLPGMVIKTADTTGNKLLKVAIAAAAALGVGWIAKRTLGSGAGKAAVIGGLAGTGAQLLAAFTNVKIGQMQGTRLLGSGRSIGDATLISPATSRSEENTGLILP